jgi:hypothetical protein
VPFCDGEAEESEDEAVSSDEDEDDDGEEMSVEEVCIALIYLLPADSIRFCALPVGASTKGTWSFFPTVNTSVQCMPDITGMVLVE